MFLTPFTSLTWAYQLHYYLGFRTHRRHPCFESAPSAQLLAQTLQEIGERHDYHLLGWQIHADQLRCSLSLRPEQSVAAAVQTIKANSARICAEQLSLSKPVWARGYLALSIGRMRIAAVRQYLDSQATHHGYAARLLPPVFRFKARSPISLKTNHSFFELNYHLVFATWQRRGVFTSGLGQILVEYWLRVAAKRGFAIDQVSVVPDHVHVLVRLLPQITIEECGLSLLNNSQHFIGERYPEMLVQRKLHSCGSLRHTRALADSLRLRWLRLGCVCEWKRVGWVERIHNCRWWSSPLWSVGPCRLRRSHPPTSVGGLFEMHCRPGLGRV